MPWGTVRRVQDDVLPTRQEDVSQIQMVGRNVHGNQRFGPAVCPLQSHGAGQKPKAVLPPPGSARPQIP